MTIQDRRREARQRRKAITGSMRTRLTLAASKRMITLPEFKRARLVGLYLSSDGELDTSHVLARCHKDRKGTYLPVITSVRHAKMNLARYKKHEPLAKNHWGIKEPVSGYRRKIPTLQIDLIIVPLVMFDTSGTRVGMGKGFYDRMLAFKRQSPHRPPLIAGFAFDCQESTSITRQSWDIPLNLIITPTRTIRCRNAG